MTRAATPLPDAPTTATAVFQMITGHYLSTAVNAAARLELADAMADGVHDHQTLARRTGTHPDSLLRLLYLLASAGLLTDEGEGRFALTEAGRLLRKDADLSLHAVALMHAGPGHIQRWISLPELLREPPKGSEDKPRGNPFAQMPPHVAQIFHRAMTFFSQHTSEAVVRSYDFGRFRSLVDVGGGEGTLLAAILRANPELRGTLFDLPSAGEAGRRTLAEAGLAGRGEVVDGDFFTSVPAGHDAYLLKSVLHDWDDDASRTLLANIRAAMKPDSRLLLVETIRPDRFDTTAGSLLAAYSHLGMLFNGGAERSEREFRSLLGGAGLELNEITWIRPAWSGVANTAVIEAVVA
ncbi:methyltransferase [Micromonospora sp. B11E3]|uniref:methyltransferase n=1 Tax=Micromonospora sp. B11E3 TaxID=3153562 RepID=UPI00325EA4BC